MSETVTSKLVSRSELRSYMNVSTGDVAAVYELIGEGFTSLTEAKNPKEYSRQYIHEKTERTDVVGYAPSLDYSVDIYTNNKVIKRIREITDKEMIGTDAQVSIVTVEMFSDSTVDNTKCVAYERKYAVIPDSKGDGVEALVYSGTFKAVGDIVTGTFNVDTKAFTVGTDAQQTT